MLGALVPFNLRPRDRHVRSCHPVTMQLADDSYMHGIMDGEVTDFEEFYCRNYNYAEIWGKTFLIRNGDGYLGSNRFSESASHNGTSG